jgi:uncharacterized membrane protein YoaK (UPF0700 family)
MVSRWDRPAARGSRWAASLSRTKIFCQDLCVYGWLVARDASWPEKQMAGSRDDTRHAGRDAEQGIVEVRRDDGDEAVRPAAHKADVPESNASGGNLVIGALRDAWHTIVPDTNDRHGPLPPLLVLLTVVTGLVDAFSYLLLGHVFVANMTGNVVFAGFALADAPGFSIRATAVAVAAFASGAFVGGRIVHSFRSNRARLLHLALAAETILVMGAFVVAELSGWPIGTDRRYLLIALLGLGMGVQNAAARALAVPDLTTTVLTLTITGTAADSHLAGGAGAKAGRRLLSTAAMFLGGLIGALVILHGHTALPLLFAAVALAICCATAWWLARSSAPWTQPT